MKINIPSIKDQRRIVFESSTQEGIQILKTNLSAPEIQDIELDESGYSNKHLLRLREGWEVPHPDVVNAYINQFKNHTDHNTDAKVGEFLGLTGSNVSRRVRSWKEPDKTVPVPYGIWRRLLVATGRAPQEIIPVVAFMS